MKTSQSQHAPLVLFTYNRPEALKQTLEALTQNILADETDLIVFSDAGKKADDRHKVDEVRAYLRQIGGFNSLKVIQREENFGLARNIIEGVTAVIEEYGRVIVLEDDLLTSRNFLLFMNKALDHYAHRPDIFAVSGYTADLRVLSEYPHDTYLSYRPSAWGWGTWKDQWDGIDWDVKDFDELVNDRAAIRRFERGGADMTRMLRHYMEGKNDSWAIRWSYAMHKRDAKSVHPRISKVQNIGFGDDATHCKGVNIYKTVLDQSDASTFDLTTDEAVDPQIAKAFRYQFSYTNKAIKRVQEYAKGVFR